MWSIPGFTSCMLTAIKVDAWSVNVTCARGAVACLYVRLCITAFCEKCARPQIIDMLAISAGADEHLPHEACPALLSIMPQPQLLQKQAGRKKATPTSLDLANDNTRCWPKCMLYIDNNTALHEHKPRSLCTIHTCCMTLCCCLHAHAPCTYERSCCESYCIK